LFYGPPGNGKTHFLKALLHEVGKPCLYVKSIQGTYNGGHEAIRRIFTRARRIAPCFLVFEDLETIVTDENRSFFLNELDGFAENSGIVTLATTNFPERIDPAIVDRPSRFDRKYLFDLPALEERTRYLARWSDGLVPEMQLGTTALRRAGEKTAGFSFAYLKELCLSALMRWIDLATPGSMDSIVEKQISVLDDQVRRGKSPEKRDGRRVGLVPEA
jgi:AAA+ superfamily predicted ATPase